MRGGGTDLRYPARQAADGSAFGGLATAQSATVATVTDSSDLIPEQAWRLLGSASSIRDIEQAAKLIAAAELDRTAHAIDNAPYPYEVLEQRAEQLRQDVPAGSAATADAQVAPGHANDHAAGRVAQTIVEGLGRRLAAALALALHDGHPTYGSTARWRGGIGGQTVTTGCSFIDPPPGVTFTQHDLLSTPLREFLAAYPFDLTQTKANLRTELEQKLAR